MTAEVSIKAIDERRTRVSIVSVFESTEAMARLTAMRVVEEGLTQAVGQFDAIIPESWTMTPEQPKNGSSAGSTPPPPLFCCGRLSRLRRPAPGRKRTAGAIKGTKILASAPLGN